MTDDELEAGLRALGAALAIPAARSNEASDPARRARIQIADAARLHSRRPIRRWLRSSPGDRLVRGLVLAVLAAIAIAAVAGAIGVVLPGIRIFPAPASVPVSTPPASIPSAGSSTGGAIGPSPSPPFTPTPTPIPTIASPLGSNLGLGDPVAIESLEEAVDFPLSVPPRGRFGPPTTAWIRDARLTLVWTATPTLPATAEPGVGLILSQFRGAVDEAYFAKLLDQGTTISTVLVGGETGYWISGAPHEIVYVDDRGEPQFDSRRSVGDTLLWARGGVTFRLESGLGRAATIDLAASMP